MYRLLGDNHTLGGLPFAAQVFLRALEGVRDRLADESGVSGTELRALSSIAEHAGQSASSMGAFLELAASVTGELVDRLVDRGLVSTAVEADQETVSLNLTLAGHALIGKAYEGFQQSIMNAADSLDDERRSAFESGMLKMARKLDDQGVKPGVTSA